MDQIDIGSQFARNAESLRITTRVFIDQNCLRILHFSAIQIFKTGRDRSTNHVQRQGVLRPQAVKWCSVKTLNYVPASAVSAAHQAGLALGGGPKFGGGNLNDLCENFLNLVTKRI